jgi:DNA-binding beta-propeller fold protein YncE
MWMRAVALSALALAGCGSARVAELPAPAEPERSPALDRPPAGRVLDIGAPPQGVAVEPASGIVAVGVGDPAALVLVDGRELRTRHRVALPGAPRHLAAADGRFLVPAEHADRYVEVAPGGDVVASVATGHRPHDVAAVGGRLFVSDERAASLSVIEDGRRTAAVAVAVEPGGVSAAGGLVAVVSVRERVLELYDARTLRRVARAPAGIGPTHVATVGAWAYVVDTDGDALLVFRTAPELELVRRYPLPGSPYGIALDPRRRRLWVTLTGRNELVELPAHGRPHALRRFATVRQPDTVAVDPSTGRVFVTGRADGVLQAIDPGGES